MVKSLSTLVDFLNNIGKTKVSIFLDKVKDLVPQNNALQDIPITTDMRDELVEILTNADASGELLLSVLTSKPNALDLLKDLVSKNISRDLLVPIVNLLRNKEEIIRLIVNEAIKKFTEDLGTNLNTLRNLSYKTEVDNLINDYKNGTLSINSIKPIENAIKKDVREFITTMAPYIAQLFQSARDDPVNFFIYITQEVARNSKTSTPIIKKGKLLKRNKNINSMREVSGDATEEKTRLEKDDDTLVFLYIVLLILIHIDTKKSIDNFYKLFDEIEKLVDLNEFINNINEKKLMNEILSVPKSLTDLYSEVKNSDDVKTAIRENNFITSIIGTINDQETTKDILIRLLKKTCIYIDDFNINEISDIELLPQNKFTQRRIDFASLNDLLNITPKFQEISEINDNAENGLYIIIYEKVNADTNAVKEEIRQYIFINRNSNLKEVIHFAVKSLYYIVCAFSCSVKSLSSIEDIIEDIFKSVLNDNKYEIESVGNFKKGADTIRNKYIDNFDKYGQELIKIRDDTDSYTQEEYDEAEKKFVHAQSILFFYDVISGDLKKLIYYTEKLLRNTMIIIIPLIMTIWLDIFINYDGSESILGFGGGSSIDNYIIEYFNTILNKDFTVDEYKDYDKILTNNNDRFIHILESNFYKMTTNGQVSYFSFINNKYDNTYAQTIFSANNSKIESITADYAADDLPYKLVEIKTSGFTVNYDKNYMIVNYLYGENTTIEPCYPITLDKGSYVNINNDNEKFTIDENNTLIILNNNYKLDGNTYDVKTINIDELQDLVTNTENVETTIGYYNGLYFIIYNLFFNVFQILKPLENLKKIVNGVDIKANIGKIDFVKTYNDVYTKKTYFLDLNIDNYSNNENIFLPYQMCFISYKDDTFVDIISRKVYKKEPEKEPAPESTILADGNYHINLYNSDGSSINISTLNKEENFKTYLYLDYKINPVAVAGKEEITIAGAEKIYNTITIQNEADGVIKKFYYDDKVKKYKTITQNGEWSIRTDDGIIAQTPHSLTVNNNNFTTEITYIMLTADLNTNEEGTKVNNVKEEDYGKVGDGLKYDIKTTDIIRNSGFFYINL